MAIGSRHDGETGAGPGEPSREAIDGPAEQSETAPYCVSQCDAVGAEGGDSRRQRLSQQLAPFVEQPEASFVAA